MNGRKGQPKLTPRRRRTPACKQRRRGAPDCGAGGSSRDAPRKPQDRSVGGWRSGAEVTELKQQLKDIGEEGTPVRCACRRRSNASRWLTAMAAGGGADQESIAIDPTLNGSGHWRASAENGRNVNGGWLSSCRRPSGPTEPVLSPTQRQRGDPPVAAIADGPPYSS